MDPLALPVGSYTLAAPAASCRRLVNCFVQEAPPERPRGSPAILVRGAGIASFADTGETEVRGFTKFNGTLYACAGGKLYSIAANGDETALTGTSITGSGPVRMTNDGETIVVTPGNGAAFSSDGATVAQITDPDFLALGGDDVCQLDGYFVFRVPDSPEILNSDLNDITFDALNIASAEGAPGNLVGLNVNNRELIAVKEDSTEIWYDAANPTGSPFARSPDGFKELGCAASLSLVTQDNSPVMLASDKTFRRLASVWTRFSNHGIEAVLQRLSTLADCLALPYTQEGHLFVAFTFPNGGRTLVMDFTSGEWHERESLRASGASVGSWRVQAITQCYGKQIVGDRLSGKIGFLDPDTYTEWDEPQVMEWTYQPVYSQGLSASHGRLDLGITGGYGTASGQGVDPKLTLYVSDDGGNTFRARPIRSLGAMGAYETRVAWENLGESRNRVYRCRMSDPVRLMVLDTQLSGDGLRL